eukprot:8101782-Pyramimonas_sp.AAC.1
MAIGPAHRLFTTAKALTSSRKRGGGWEFETGAGDRGSSTGRLNMILNWTSANIMESTSLRLTLAENPVTNVIGGGPDCHQIFSLGWFSQ